MITVTCGSDFVRNGGSCYKFHSETTSYSSAKSTCESEGAMLAEVGSLEENTYINGKDTFHRMLHNSL